MKEKHILIIEDDPDLSDVLVTILTSYKYKVTAHKDSTDIVQMALNIAPDLVITDYILEGINGGEYCGALKRDPRTAHIPVIILSGYGRVLNSLGHYGADRVMDKPFNNDELITTISELLAG